MTGYKPLVNVFVMHKKGVDDNFIDIPVKKGQHLNNQTCLKLVDPDTLIEAFGQLHTYHKLIRVFRWY